MLKYLAFLGLCCCCLSACGNEPVKQMAHAAPVHVAAVEKGDLVRVLNAVGNVQASASVAVTPRVDGQIVEVYFTEGEEVKAGQPLLKIDPRPYAAELAEKKANLAKAEAQLVKAEHDRKRFAQLVANGYVSKEAFEQTMTDAATLKSTVRAAKADADVASLNLSFCDIKAPISGRIGELKMQKGSMVKDNDTGPIATIDTIRPCRVNFSVPEAYLPTIQERMREERLGITAMPVGGQPEQGIITLLDNNVDTKTGAIRLRGEFENPESKLWPGQFVEVKLPLGKLRNATLVPARAIQTGRDETFVYVVCPDNTVDYRKVNILFETDGKSAVAGDLTEGEIVVVDGQVRLAPGLPVQIQN